MTELELMVILPFATIYPGPLIVELEIVISLLTKSFLSLYEERFIVLFAKDELFILDNDGPVVQVAPDMVPSLLDCVWVSFALPPVFS